MDITDYFKQYSDFVDYVTAEVSKNDDIYSERFKYLSEKLNGQYSRMDNAVAGLAGEAGEVADVWKKVKFHGLDFDEDTKQLFIKELGDVCWYLCSVCIALNIPLEQVINMNIEKLKKRHPNGFSSVYLDKYARKAE